MMLVSPHANFYQNSQEASYIRIGRLTATLRLTGLILRSRAAAFDVDLFRSSFASFLCCCGRQITKKGISKDSETTQMLGKISSALRL